ncbi:hypothetical protein [Solirubrum puertoriconensis]|uniref:Outer membrane protein beta-barrel domain-containing protein n=1 Tax=Solirubrum puertoriconensis TaxID=1751427 RepID=A0A9X0L6E5_SOLP1|nr:hypothetical protein [Solirubrum puertoriconensis]KUG09651.1 hypothetical protein ASU33_18340 [Solirubrum puertoriconensis]
MITPTIRAIGAAFSLAVFTTLPLQAQSELAAKPDTSRLTARPLPPPAASAAAGRPPLYRPSSLGMSLGWGAPYGWGFEYSQLVSPNLEVNGGLGVGLGGKIGVGVRYYIEPTKRVSPFFGANLARSGRFANVTLAIDDEEVQYSLRPSGVLHLRTGLRWQPGRFGMLGTFGYGLVFTGDPATYHYATYGRPSKEMRSLVRFFGPGGPEVSLGFLIGLGY